MKSTKNILYMVLQLNRIAQQRKVNDHKRFYYDLQQRKLV